ncbi:phosphoribosylglycinamide formyltransferase [Rhizorhapis sp. SPR117]|uniref:phosphoribosylglycinamide formyltransferase n=1 Tax=Rhizorhapis sp. SPR117 TaxID=2912611 RepID=UPI001F00C6D2|nr:phosphoribosylglycinamide formyltransferase [Rhizorhapis sp. SPR117]
MAKARVAVLISGRGSNMAALVYAAKHPGCPFEIVLVAANDPEAPGLQFAQAEGIPTFALDHKGMKRAEFDALIDAQVRKAGTDYIALAGYMRLLSPEFVGKWEGRMLNIHPSLLPKYKGLHTHERAIAAGDTVAGCSVHVVTAELDDGPVLGQTEVAILPGDTPATLADRTLIAEHQLYSRELADYVTRESNPDWLLANIREIALALPETAEKPSHGSPGFFVEGGKFFAYFSHNHHQNGITGLLVKTSGVEEQAMLIDSDPALYYRPAYLGPSGWIGISLDQRPVDWAHVGEWLAKSWRMSAPKRLTKLLDVIDQI